MNNNGNFIKKHKKENNFTVLDNNIFQNKNLSLKAKGLLSMLLSLPDNWQFSERGLTALSKDGRDGLRSGLDELEENGYLVREMGRNAKGQFENTIYNVFETPITEKPWLENPTAYKELSNKVLNNKELSNINTLVESDKKTIPYQEIIDYFNKINKKNLKNVPSHQKFIRARWNEGYRLNDFKTVIDNKFLTWKGTEWEKYLRPSTLFGTKFDEYLNEINHNPINNNQKGVLNEYSKLKPKD